MKEIEIKRQTKQKFIENENINSKKKHIQIKDIEREKCFSCVYLKNRKQKKKLNERK